MLLQEIMQELALQRVSGQADEKQVPAGVYISDLLSVVMANAKKNEVWLTHQGHQNIVAVATLLELSCVIVGGGMVCQVETIRKANEENISLFTSELPLYELAGRLYALGLRTSIHAEMD